MSFPPSKKKKGGKDEDTQGMNSSNSTRCRILKDRRRELDLHRSPSVSLNFQPTYVKTKERARDLRVKTNRPIYPPTLLLLLGAGSPGSDRREQRVYRGEISCYSFVPREPTRRHDQLWRPLMFTYYKMHRSCWGRSKRKQRGKDFSVWFSVIRHLSFQQQPQDGCPLHPTSYWWWCWCER